MLRLSRKFSVHALVCVCALVWVDAYNCECICVRHSE